MRKEHKPMHQSPLVKVPVSTSFKCPLSACSGLTNAVRWLPTVNSELPLKWKEAVDGESERRASYCKKHGAGSPYTYRTHRERGPGSCFKAAAVQQTQPWPTSRSKGSSGSSKKLSKAKRCGNVSGSFLLRFNAFLVTVQIQLKYKLSVDGVTETKITSANVRSHSRVLL